MRPPESVEQVSQRGLDIEVLFREHAAFVHRAASYLGIAPHDVGDVTQEVFLVAHRRGPEFEGRASVRTWLYRICLRVASDWRKRAHRRRELSVAEPPDRPTDRTPEADSADAELRSRLRAALGALDDDPRTVFVLFEIEELSMEEVASIVGCPVKTAYSRLYAARRALSAALSEETVLALGGSSP